MDSCPRRCYKRRGSHSVLTLPQNSPEGHAWELPVQAGQPGTAVGANSVTGSVIWFVPHLVPPIAFRDRSRYTIYSGREKRAFLWKTLHPEHDALPKAPAGLSHILLSFFFG